jgi:hypothetical protein
MKKISISVLVALLLVATLTVPAMGKGGNIGTTIQDGVLLYSATHYLAGQQMKVGYDIFGYNYQAHLFKGSYANAYLGGYGYPPYEGDPEAYLAVNPSVANLWVWPYRDVQLEMKWNDAWISNMDCDGDGKLDRHYGFASYVGSGAWETNHMKGKDNGNNWVDFVKIVAVPADAIKAAGMWYTADGIEIGPDIWGEFALIQEVYDDQGTGDHGLLYNAPGPTGFGYY